MTWSFDTASGLRRRMSYGEEAREFSISGDRASASVSNVVTRRTLR
jgi:hypothetical protein